MGASAYEVFVKEIAKRIAFDSGIVADIMELIAKSLGDPPTQPMGNDAMPPATAQPLEAAAHARRDRLQRDDAGFVTVLTRTPHICAGAIAGLASALWLNVVAPFAGLVAASGALIIANTLAIALGAVLAMLLATAGTLLAADWRDEAASREAWAEIDVATAEFLLPGGTVVPNQIDPRYLTAIDDETLLGAFRDRRLKSQAPWVDGDTAASCATRIVGASGAVLPPETAPTNRFSWERMTRLANDFLPQPKILHPWPRARKKYTAALSAFDRGPAFQRRGAGVSLLRAQLVVSSKRARRRVLHVEPTLGVVRLVANGGVWSDWLTCSRRSLLPSRLDGQVADVVVLTGDRGEHRERDHDPSSKNIPEVAASPNCRGPPTSGGQRSHSTQTLPPERTNEGSRKVPTAGVPRTVDPVVRDNLGRDVPVCAAELDVIETYLDRPLRDLLAPGMTAQDQDKA